MFEQSFTGASTCTTTSPQDAVTSVEVEAQKEKGWLALLEWMGQD